MRTMRMRRPSLTLSGGFLFLVLYGAISVYKLQRERLFQEEVPGAQEGDFLSISSLQHYKEMQTSQTTPEKAVTSSIQSFSLNGQSRVIRTTKHTSKFPARKVHTSSNHFLPLDRQVRVARKTMHKRPSPTATRVLYSLTTNTTILEEAEKKSSLDYFTCCGLGHRMSKLVDANYVAKQKNLALRVHWGFCNDGMDIFQELFGPQPLHQLQNITSTGKALCINNEVPGFKKLIRKGPDEPCMCQKSVMDVHARFYESIRNRFRRKLDVDAFRQTHFSNYTVIGMHVRAGNGEGGDFVHKNRGINNTDIWTKSVAQNLVNMSTDWEIPPLLFVATDTLSIITALRGELQGKMRVVDFEQTRKKEGAGVFFGAAAKVSTKVDECLEGWEDALMDMMLLSHADVVVAGRPSSFTQSLPMSIALARPQSTRKVPHTFCEFHPSGTSMRCYEEALEWCCEGKTDFHLEDIRRYEYRRMPVDLESQTLNIRERTDRRFRQKHREVLLCAPRNKCTIPYDWNNP
jgi:hypothetical protein